jgi:hypothetical protein
MRYDIRSWEELGELAGDMNEGDTIHIHIENHEIGAKVQIVNGENGHSEMT